MISYTSSYSPVPNKSGCGNSRGLEKILKLNRWGAAISGGVTKCRSNGYFQYAKRVIPLSSLSVIITGMTFSYVVSASEGNLPLV